MFGDSVGFVDAIAVIAVIALFALVAVVAVVMTARFIVIVFVDIVLWEIDPVAELRVAPSGVIKELVAAMVSSTTGDPTRLE